MKRTKYVVHYTDNNVARFSHHRHAMWFAWELSKHSDGLVEVGAADGLIGQYKNGEPTTEFEQHHIDWFST